MGLTVLNLAAGTFLLTAMALAVGSAAQAVTGFGFSLIVVPVLLLLIGPLHTVRLANEAAICVNLLLLARDHRTVQVRDALLLLLPALAVTPLAAYVVHRSDPAVLSIVIGALVVGCALALVSGRRIGRLRGRSGMAIAGTVSAAMNSAGGVGGPAVAMYALNAGWPFDVTTPTLQIYFAGLNLLSIAVLGPVTLAPASAAGIVFAIVVGVIVGTVLARRLDVAVMTRAVIVTAVAGGAAAMIRGALRL
jgi:uncharacterized membrane protein YfcA